MGSNSSTIRLIVTHYLWDTLGVLSLSLKKMA